MKARFAGESQGDGSGAQTGAQPGTAPAATLEGVEGLAIETPAVWLPSAHEIAWRIRPRTAGLYELRLHMNGAVLSKTVLVLDAAARRSPVRPDGLLDQLLYPSEPPLPPAPA